MFTGIIVAVGTLVSCGEQGADRTLCIEAAGLDPQALRTGDSISVQGVCLTVTRFFERCFWADVSRETLDKTTLGRLKAGTRVNLEPALRVGDLLGGHLVSGHVDTVGGLVNSRPDARSWRMEFEVPAEFSRFIAPKGAICLDGISLTVNDVRSNRFDVNIIPHTFSATSLGERVAGDPVNVEIDQIARYLDRLLSKT